ncbi:MAG: winged helix-turn-helix transcriptional regulator [Bacteroides sp.]|nr:winged helix-turn-helix transcriptional regulator [Bacteroides sp.]
MKNEITTYRMPCVGCLIGTAFQRLTTQLETALKAAGLKITSAEYMILRALYSQDGLQQCEIAGMVGKDKASVSRSVTALAGKELVRSEQISHKCCRVWLTAKGREIETRIMTIADERHKALTDLVSREDLEAFQRVLNSIIK